ARYVFFKPRMALLVRPGLTAQGKEKVRTAVIDGIQKYVDGLGSGAPAVGSDILQAAKGADRDVADVKIADVITWRSDLGDPGAGVLTDAVLAAMAETPAGDTDALRGAIEAALTGNVTALAPTGRRIPDRNLVQGPSGARATDDEIEAAQFTVSATV